MVVSSSGELNQLKIGLAIGNVRRDGEREKSVGGRRREEKNRNIYGTGSGERAGVGREGEPRKGRGRSNGS